MPVTLSDMLIEAAKLAVVEHPQATLVTLLLRLHRLCGCSFACACGPHIILLLIAHMIAMR